MPSRYEPCGLNQLYSLAYGAVPVVHETGGLADTIVNLTPESADARTANGFSFNDYRSEPLLETLRRALDVLTQQPNLWAQLVETGMSQDWSWSNSARHYQALYESLIARRK